MAKVISIPVVGQAPDAAAREQRISRLLVAYIVAGLGFMLLPGTFLGVWNLFTISHHRAAHTVSDLWIQAHGHAQVFGWIGCFILGIGFHSIPKMRGEGNRFAIAPAWVSLMLWTSGVTLRWLTNLYQWHWRILLPASACLELAAFVIFFRAVSRHKAAGEGSSRAKFDAWIFVVIAGTVGLLATLALNLWECFRLALQGSGPVFPADFDQRFLTLMAWGFIVPHIWGFSAKWLPIFLGLKPTRTRALLVAVAMNAVGVGLALYGKTFAATVVILHGALISASALRIFARSERPAKTNGIHPSFPWFVRIAYAWMRIAAVLAIWAAKKPDLLGLWGASRHALTVGFVSLMVFCIGQRVLPAFAGMKLLWSPRLMLANCSLLTLGCTLRVTAEVVAYGRSSSPVWALLPISAVVEMAAVTLFAINLVMTFAQRPAHALRLEEEAAGTPLAVNAMRRTF